jgi:twitching motility protein PilJ
VGFALNQHVKQVQSGADNQNQRTQDAILRLLDEMSALADGDLTIQTTVTEDVTGAIADSVNYTIEALRDLVTTMNQTSEEVASGTEETLATAQQLTRASQTQSQQIGAANETIGKMLGSIQMVAGNATRAAEVTQRSVQVAQNGGEAVKRTIQGMDIIREQIQETSKRIKRLGESSQEIGNIIELITDIAEQTNTLALNASIQAAMAGEAGRGFAVVADEVQRLAERSNNATKQIEAIVRTIQADTNEAIISMEKSTSGVVGGAKLAENAGQALDEIQKVSGQIATIVQEISSATRQQTAEAATVSQTMSQIRALTEQTAQGTKVTGESIGRLAQLAVQLKQSVAGFRLS